MNLKPADVFKFRLYVAGDAPNSILALANLNAFCKLRHISSQEIEIINVFKNPKRALADGIVLAPTLVKCFPLPTRKFIGTLSEYRVLDEAFGLSTTNT